MPTTRFCALVGIPERTYRRWQAHARAGRVLPLVFDAPRRGKPPRHLADLTREEARHKDLMQEAGFLASAQ